jgi:hypothetical protein
MPTSPSPAKRPGPFSWIGYAVLAVIAFLAVAAMMKSTIRPFMNDEGEIYMRSQTVGDTASMPLKDIAPGMPGSDLAYAEESMARDSFMPSPQPPASGSAAVDLDGNSITPKLIKTGELTLRVEDAPKTVEDVRTYIGTKQGFVESSSLSDSGSGPRSAYLVLRIPVDAFEETLRGLKQFATLVVFENIHGQDVTMEFVDIEADLRNARAEEASYLEILKRSGEIEDVLAVTQRLAEVRGRIERLDGRKRYLSNRTDLATISVTLTEDTRVAAPTKTWRPLEVLKDAFQDLIVSLQELVNFLIRLVIGLIGLLLPIALIVGFFIWIGWKIVKWILKRVR